MCNDKLREKILEYVEGGIKATQLYTNLVVDKCEGKLPLKDGSDETFECIRMAIQRLIDEREIVEIEYVMPSVAHRVKSFYLPKGTKISIVDPETTDIERFVNDHETSGSDGSMINNFGG